MTVKEFKERFEQDTPIICEHVEERALVLDFLDSIGYEIGVNSNKYRFGEPNYNNTNYMHPVFSGGRVACTMDPSYHNKPGVCAKEVIRAFNLNDMESVIPDDDVSFLIS